MNGSQTVVTDPVERRKIQNRVAQRKFRSRRNQSKVNNALQGNEPQPASDQAILNAQAAHDVWNGPSVAQSNGFFEPPSDQSFMQQPLRGSGTVSDEAHYFEAHANSADPQLISLFDDSRLQNFPNPIPQSNGDLYNPMNNFSRGATSQAIAPSVPSSNLMISIPDNSSGSGAITDASFSSISNMSPGVHSVDKDQVHARGRSSRNSYTQPSMHDGRERVVDNYPSTRTAFDRRLNTSRSSHADSTESSSSNEQHRRQQKSGDNSDRRSTTSEPRSIIDAQERDSLPTLHIAAYRGRDTSVQILLQHGVDVFERDDAGRTALQLAAMQGHTSIMKQLLQVGASVTAVDELGRTALHWAILQKQEKALRLLLDTEDIKTIINYQDINGWSALHVAVERGFDIALELLLSRGANLNMKARKCEVWKSTEPTD